MYAAIDMKSFYASVECVERGLDPLTTNLVVADSTRTNKTICLAVSPALKSYGIPGRPRLFEVEQKVRTINYQRRKNNKWRAFKGKSSCSIEIEQHPEYELDYITAPPQMLLYEKYSTRIYSVFLKFFSPEDIHVYSCDEAFLYIEPYLNTYRMTAHELIMKVIKEVLAETGITATAGIGTNMYLCKVAMDIVAKKMPADEDGVRIAELDEISYREKLWEHVPLQDFWGYGRGITSHLERLGIHNMGELCLMSEYDDEKLYKEFGINAEILIDHAWGYESCTIGDIQAYSPKNRSLSNSQVLSRAYNNEEAEIVMREMVDSLVLKLVEAECVTDQISLYISFDGQDVYDDYRGHWSMDMYGRKMPRPVSCNKKIEYTSSSKQLIEEFVYLYRYIVDTKLSIRKIGIGFQNVIAQKEVPEEIVQYSLFDDVEELERQKKSKEIKSRKEKSLQNAVLNLKHRYGKNAVLRGMSFQEGATARERNMQIGGHKA